MRLPASTDHDQDADAARVRGPEHIQGEMMPMTLRINDSPGLCEVRVEIPPHRAADDECEQDEREDESKEKTEDAAEAGHGAKVLLHKDELLRIDKREDEVLDAVEARLPGRLPSRFFAGRWPPREQRLVDDIDLVFGILGGREVEAELGVGRDDLFEQRAVH